METEAKHIVVDAINTLLKQIPKKTTPNKITFFSVPAIAAEHKELCKPKMVPIGPYHQDEQKFKAIEKKKLEFMHDFLHRIHKEDILETYFQAIENLKDQAHECYREFPCNEKFVQMLLMDGCFILELLLKLDEDKHHCHYWAEWDFMDILSDLLLIKNQIPFFVLEKLYTTFLSAKSNENTSQLKPADLKSLVVANLFVTYLGVNKKSSSVKGLGNNEIHHLLHLYYKVSLPHPGNQKDSPHPDIKKELPHPVNPEVLINDTVAHTMETTDKHRLAVVIPSATQLVELGFVFTKQDSHNNSDATIKGSMIKIPSLIIDSTRKTILMNLLAFEQNLDESKRRWTDLMVMMNCIIKNKSDLEILQRSRIVLNLLPSEDEAVQFFRKLSKRVTIELNGHYYYTLFEQINKKCEHYLRKRRAVFMHEYFNNRWAVISFCTSICAIFLATVQTLVSVFTYRHHY